jgi:hypothetical protein
MGGARGALEMYTKIQIGKVEWELEVCRRD